MIVILTTILFCNSPANSADDITSGELWHYMESNFDWKRFIFVCEYPPPIIQETDYFDCCSGPLIFSNDEYPQCNYTNAKFQALLDAIDCLVNNTNLVKQDQMDFDLILTRALERTGNLLSFWNETLTSVLDDCSNSTQQPEIPVFGSPTSSQVYNMLVHIFKNIISLCPNEIFSNATECILLRKYVQQCDRIPRYNSEF